MESETSFDQDAYAASLGITPDYLAAAENAHQRGDVELRTLGAISDGELQALYLHAYQNLRSNRPQLAARQFLALTQFDRTQARFYVGLGLCFQHMREFGWAEAVYAEALRREPEDRIAMVLQGECALFLDGKNRAHDILSRAISLGAQQPDDVAYIERAKGLVARIRKERAGKSA